MWTLKAAASKFDWFNDKQHLVQQSNVLLLCFNMPIICHVELTNDCNVKTRAQPSVDVFLVNMGIVMLDMFGGIVSDHSSVN